MAEELPVGPIEEAMAEGAGGLEPARARRGLITLLVAAFCVEFAVAVVRLSIQFLGIKHGASAMVLGLYGTFSAGVYGLMALVSGRASDRLGRRIACAAIAAMAFVWLVIGRQTSAYAVLFLLPVFTGMLAYFWPPVMAWLGDMVGARGLNRALGTFNMVWTVGLMLGPVASGYLWVRNNYAPFAVGATIAWVTAAVLMTAPVVRRRRTGSGAVPEGDAPDPRASIYAPMCWLANFVTYASVGIERALWPKLAKDLGIGEVTVGWVSFCLYGGELVAFLVLRQTTAWHYRRAPTIAGLLLGAAGMGAAYLGHSPVVFMAGFFITGLAVGFAYVASLYYSLTAPAARRGRRAGVHEMTVGAGGSLGPLMGGAVATWFQPRTAFGAQSLVFVAAALGLSLWLLLARRGARST